MRSVLLVTGVSLTRPSTDNVSLCLAPKSSDDEGKRSLRWLNGDLVYYRAVSTRPDFSVIIPTRHRRELLISLLERLARLPGPSREVIVLDDASVDGTNGALKERFPDVTIIRSEEPRGFDAIPRAVEISRGRFLMQLDDDAYPDDGTLQLVFDHFQERGPELGLVAMPFIEPNSGRVGYHPYFPRLPQGVDYGPARGFAAGAVAVRREVALAVPLSPPGYFMYETEVPATIEFLRAGWEIDFLPGARVFHLWNARRKVDERAAYLALRNDLVTIRRYFTGWRRTEMLVGRYIAGLVHLSAAGAPRAVLEAHGDAKEMLNGRYAKPERVPDEVLERIYPSFDGLTLLTLFGETNRRRVAWFLGRLPIDQIA